MQERYRLPIGGVGQIGARPGPGHVGERLVQIRLGSERCHRLLELVGHVMDPPDRVGDQDAGRHGLGKVGDGGDGFGDR